MIGGLSLFLFGMNIMGEALRSARVENRNFEKQYRGYAEKYSLK